MKQRPGPPRAAHKPALKPAQKPAQQRAETSPVPASVQVRTDSADGAGPETLKLFSLCADGYGLQAPIDEAVRQLVPLQRLSDVSCVVTGDNWAAAGRQLAALPAVRQGRVRTGLHLNLTHGQPLASALRAEWPQFPDLQALIVMAHLGRLPMTALQDEFSQQMAAFEQTRGRAPAHVDSHQHVHHLPGVRDMLLKALAPRADIRVRHTGRVKGPGFAVKRLLIEGTGGKALGRQLEALGRHANTELMGVYEGPKASYRQLMQRWLAALPASGGLVFCRPATAGAETGPASTAGDPTLAAGEREFAYLRSPEFQFDLKAAGVRLA